MQICHLCVAFRTDALVCSLKKICLNLLKGSQNSFLGLQPESGHRHSAGLQLGGKRRKERASSLLPFLPGPLNSWDCRQGPRLGIWALPPQFSWCGQDTDWVPSLEGMRLFQYSLLLASGWPLYSHTPYLFFHFSLSSDRVNSGGWCYLWVFHLLFHLTYTFRKHLLRCCVAVQSNLGPQGAYGLPASNKPSHTDLYNSKLWAGLQQSRVPEVSDRGDLVQLGGRVRREGGKKPQGRLHIGEEEGKD